MSLRHLRIFVTVADLGSMTAAAEELFIAQPTVSQAIADLERYYNVKLFDRLSRRLYITETGTRLLSYARHIIALHDEMEQAIKHPSINGILKIGASVTIGANLLPQLISEFKNKYPSMQIHVVIKNTTDIENLIAKNAVDFGIVEGIIHSSDIVSSAFMEDELVLVCGKSHPLYRAERIPLTELGSLDFIVREEGSGTRELFESVTAANDINCRFTWECTGSDSLKQAAIAGLGVAVISERLVENEVKDGELRKIYVDHLNLKRKFAIIYHKNKYLTETMKAFFDLCYST